MASNNKAEQDILALFPDNFTNEISAEDMRTYVSSIFSDKETIVKKIDRIVNLGANNENIYEGSLVVFWNDEDVNRIGLYISKINQPTGITDLIQISTITGEDITVVQDTKEIVINTSVSIVLNPISQLILCDASNGYINITLPDPILCFESSKSFKISVHKIDISENIVNILPFGSELVVGEISQELELNGEIFNFITDGTDWYLGA